jgi:hypothetical protein
VLHAQRPAQDEGVLGELRALPGSDQPTGLRMCAIETPASPEFTRPTYSSMVLGGSPAAVTRLAFGMRRGTP